MFRTWSLSWYGRCRFSRWSSSIDVVDQSDLLGQEVDGPDAAGGDAPGPCRRVRSGCWRRPSSVRDVRRRAGSPVGGGFAAGVGSSWRWTLAFTRKPPGGERPRVVRYLDYSLKPGGFRASWVEFPGTLDDDRALNRLVAGLTGEKPPIEPSHEGRCPSRTGGVRACRRGLLLRRGALTDWLVSDLRREVRSPRGVRLLAVLGPSGSGKWSSISSRRSSPFGQRRARRGAGRAGARGVLRQPAVRGLCAGRAGVRGPDDAVRLPGGLRLVPRGSMMRSMHTSSRSGRCGGRNCGRRSSGRHAWSVANWSRG